MKDVEKSQTSFIRVNLRVLREKHLFQCPRHTPCFFITRTRNRGDAYNVHGAGPVKIKEVRYEYENTVEERRIALDAEGFVKASLKDAMTGSTTLL